MRNFGIPKVTSPAISGGIGQSPGSLRENTPRNSYPMPSGSISPDDAPERAARWFVGVFFGLWFLIPMICAGVMLKFR